jgi:hypothetical protein
MPAVILCYLPRSPIGAVLALMLIMLPPVFGQTNSFLRRPTQCTAGYPHCYFDTGEEDAPNRLFATLRENEITHANTAAFKGFDLSIRATPKIAMTERSITQTDI